MRILVVSLQKQGNGFEFKHELVKVEKETHSSFRVEPVAAVDGRTYVRKEEIENVIVESDGENIRATVWALNEVDSLPQDLLLYWKNKVKTATINHLKQQNEQIKQAYKELMR